MGKHPMAEALDTVRGEIDRICSNSETLLESWSREAQHDDDGVFSGFRNIVVFRSLERTEDDE